MESIKFKYSLREGLKHLLRPAATLFKFSILLITLSCILYLWVLLIHHLMQDRTLAELKALFFDVLFYLLVCGIIPTGGLLLFKRFLKKNLKP